MKKIILVIISSLFFLVTTILCAAADSTTKTAILSKKACPIPPPIPTTMLPVKLMEPIHFLYADMDNTTTIREPDDPLIVMESMDYKKIFGEVPLERMLRSQIKHHEYIVLDQEDLEKLDTNKDNKIEESNFLYKIFFAHVTGTVKGAYIATHAHLVNMGKLKEILINITPRGNAKGVQAPKDINDEVDEVEFTDHKDVDIKSSLKKQDSDMPWMGL